MIARPSRRGFVVVTIVSCESEGQGNTPKNDFVFTDIQHRINCFAPSAIPARAPAAMSPPLQQNPKPLLQRASSHQENLRLNFQMASAPMWSSFCSLSCPPDAAAAAVAQTIALITSASLKQARSAQHYNCNRIPQFTVVSGESRP
jgi:hypothetical protein